MKGCPGCAMAASVAAAAVLWSGPVAAQAEPAGAEQIVVTGTLIRGVSEQAPVPIEVITAEELALQGSPTALDFAKLLPGSAGVLGDAAQFDIRSQFNEGTASINLRGLGPQRTLVLLNGNRLAASGGGNVPTVDINLIPWAAIDRIEILKDGAAATYGSDAIAGVVNFITRTNQDGFLASGDYRYIDESDGDWTGALSWGGNVGPARVFLAGGYQRRSELAVTDRDWALLSYDQNPQGGFSGGGSPGNFDFNGSVGGIRFDADEGCEGLGGFRSLPGSTADLCNTNYLAFSNIVEPEERFQLYLDAELPLADRIGLRVTGLYGHTDTVLTTSPSYLPTIPPSANAAFGGSGLFVIPGYAPALIDYCQRYGAAAGCDTDASGNPQSPALAYPVRFRPLMLGGNPLFDNRRMAAKLPRNSDLYQVTGELTYDLAPGLTLRGGATFSEYDRYFEGEDNFVDLFQNALAGFGGENCAYATPQSRAGLTQAQLAALAGTGGCNFFNPFSTGTGANVITGQVNPDYAGTNNPLGFDLAPGAGLINDASTIDDFFTIIQRRANTRQWVGNLVLAGDSGLRLSGGAVQFAVGAQYRHDRYVRRYGDTNNLDIYPCPGSVLDPNATCDPAVGPLGFLGSNRNVDVGSDVWALFAEVQLPVTDRISAQVAARYEDYGAGVGSTFDPQARVKIDLADWLSVRGGIGTTFRGPPPQSTLSDLVILTFIGGAFRAVDTLGNRDLDPETATTANAGVLIHRGPFRASLDWWRYDFSGPIENEPVNGIVAALFGASGSENCGDPAYAALQARFTFSGGVCGASNVQRLRTYVANSADVTTSGLDFQASYDARLGLATVQAGISGTYVIEYDVGDVVVEGIRVQPSFDAVGKLNYQTTAYPLPRWKGYGWVQGLFGRHALRLQVNYIDGTTDQRGPEVFGPNCPVLACAAVTGGRQVDSFTTVDVSWRWTLPTRTTVSAALTNLFDTDPPFARLDQNYDPLTANPLGFTAKLGVSQAF